MANTNPEVDPAFVAALQRWRAAKDPRSEHALLGRLVGDWEVRLTFHAGPERWESACTAHAELLHGDRFLLERLVGEINAPDDQGRMRPEPYSATWLLGYDGYKQGYTGCFVENQNSHLLTFIGRKPLGAQAERIELYGFADEPMLGLGDGAMKYVLELHDAAHRSWHVYALAAGEGAVLYEMQYARVQ